MSKGSRESSRKRGHENKIAVVKLNRTAIKRRGVLKLNVDMNKQEGGSEAER